MKSFQNLFLRYFVSAFGFFFFFYVVFKHKYLYLKIQKKFPANKDYLREVFYSVISVAIFASIWIPFIYGPFSSIASVYTEGSTNIVQLLWSIPLMLFMHDTWFYWTHRWLHHPKLYRALHLVHHKSHNPSPWTAYSLHPVDGFISAMISPIIIIMLPVQVSALYLFFVIHVVYNVYFHMGYELFPKGFNQNWFSKWINTGVHHNLHHKYSKGSYGLYFTFWDRMMGTMASNYDEVYNEVKTRIAPTNG